MKSNPVKATLFLCCVSPLDRHFLYYNAEFFAKIKNKKSTSKCERERQKQETGCRGCMVVLRGIL